MQHIQRYTPTKSEFVNIPRFKGIVVSLTFLLPPLSAQDVSEDLYKY